MPGPSSRLETEGTHNLQDNGCIEGMHVRSNQQSLSITLTCSLCSGPTDDIHLELSFKQWACRIRTHVGMQNSSAEMREADICMTHFLINIRANDFQTHLLVENMIYFLLCEASPQTNVQSVGNWQ